MTYRVAIYSRDGQSYGGPEEGGWWYETFSFVKVLPKSFETREEAGKANLRVNRLLLRLQKHHRSVSSCLYSGGRHCSFVYSQEEGFPPYLPASRPHYE